MPTPESPSPNSRDPQSYLRDLAALTSLPSRWEGGDCRQVAEGLADELLSLLALDVAWVEVDGRGGQETVAVSRCRHGGDEADLAAVIRDAALFRLNGKPTAGLSPRPDLQTTETAQDGRLKSIVSSLNCDGELGVVAGASRLPGFPTEADRLLLAAAANQAAAALRRLQTDETARHAQRDLTDFLEAVPVGIHWLAPDGTILRVSRVLLDLLGYSQEEYLGRDIADFHVDSEVIADLLRRVRAGEELRGQEARMRCGDGSIKHILIDCKATWEAGKVVHTRCFLRDITEQKWAEQTLGFFAEGEADYTCVACWDGRELELEFASDGFARVTGYQPQEFNAQLAVQIVHPDEIMRVLQDMERLLSGEVIRNEARLIRRDGEVRWMRYLAQPISEPGDPRFLRIRAAAQDITDRKVGVERVYEAERRFRQMAESIQEVFWLADPARTQIFYCSSAFEEIWGRPCETLYEQPWSLFDSIVPEDRPKFIASLERQGQGEATDVEYRIVRPDRSVRLIRDRSYPIRDGSGEIFRVAAVADDITQRKRAEQTSNFLAAASAMLVELSDPVATLDRIATLAVPDFADWCLVDIRNVDGVIRRLAVAHADSTSADLAQEIFHQQPPRPSDPAGPANVLRTGEPEWSVEMPDSLLSALAQTPEQLRVLRTLGLKSYLCVPLRARSGTFGALTFIKAESGRTYDAEDLRAAEDLANRIMVAVENERLMAEFQEADRRKDEFLATLAHELRNPLAPIRNAVYLVRARFAAMPDLQRTIGIIDRQVQQMSRLVDDLLDVSRISRGQIILRKERSDLAAIVADALEASRPLIEKSGHELITSLPAEPIYVDADATRLTQVLLNVLNNAAKYTPSRGQIWLTVEREQKQVVVRVRDTGMGIPAEMLQRIFEMFTQVDRTLETSQGGLGIGLTLVQRLVEMHGGTVRAHSAGPGKGSEFVLSLPVPNEGPDHMPAAAHDQSRMAEAPTQRILLADDNRDARETMADLLECMGHEVRTAADGLEAVQLAGVYRPQVVLLDIGMPQLNGYMAAKRIRAELGPDVVIIAITGWGQDEDRRRSQEAGFDHHLTKPIDPTVLQDLFTR